MELKLKILVLIAFFSFRGISQTNEVLIKYIILDDFKTIEEELCGNELAQKYGFKIEPIKNLGQEKDVQICIENNKEIDKLLEKRNGKNWKQKYWRDLFICAYKDQKIIKEYKPINAQNLKKGDKILCPNIYFSYSGGAYVLEESLDSLKVIADFIENNPNLKIEIGIHTDELGVEEYNKKLSEFRGKSLMQTLNTQFKLNECKNFVVKGYGENDPLISLTTIERLKYKNYHNDLHRLNRRIELKILNKL